MKHNSSRASKLSGAALLLLVTASGANAQLSIVTNLPGTFTDISGTGTPLSLADDASAAIITTVGNALLPAGSVAIGSNGAVRFNGSSTALGFTNAAIPNAGAFAGEQCLMPFWDDINTQSGAFGQIYWQEIAGVLIVQWHNVEFFGSAGQGTATFQIQVPSTGTTWARYIYTDIVQPRPNGGGSATIGYQADGWGNDVQFSFDTPGAVSNTSVLSLVGTFSPPPPPNISRFNGTPPGATANLNFDTPFVASGPIASNSSAFTSAGIASVSLVGTWTALGDLMTVGSNVSGQGLVSVGGVLSIAGPNQPLDGPSAGAGLDIRLAAPANVFGVLFVDQVGFTYDISLYLGPTLLGTGQFIYGPANTFPSPPDYWTTTMGAFDRIVITDTFGGGGWGIDDIAFDSGTPTVGTNYCTANVNSTGQTGLISGSGSAVVANNNLTLEASRLPNNAFGYFLTSLTQAVTPNPGGSLGILCLGGQIGRYTGPGQIQNSGGTGSFSLLLNLTQIPTPTGFVPAVVGQTRSFQTWHRDSVGGAAVSNFTNGLAVTFL
jgi:hypothetical protein